MPRVVVSVEGLNKKYRLGQISGATLNDDLRRWWAAQRGRPDPTLPIGMAGRVQNGGRGEIFALRDINFEVSEGEILGVIGRNGAGKSTLLKILSKITAPTDGRVKIRGRVGSLLEVGTGFHPELTGRENIYLNGAILGMRKTEIDRMLDEIVDFSEIEGFIDTPVKRYSSGMYVRLAFSVAAFLDSEILLIDEVLAVGDVGFQKRCLSKMENISRDGRTVIFVSHNIGAVRKLCGRSILVDQGCITRDEVTATVIHEYLAGSDGRRASAVFRERQDVSAQVLGVRIRDGAGRYMSVIDAREEFAIEFDVEIRKLGLFRIVAALWSAEGDKILTSISTDSLDRERFRIPARYVATVTIPGALMAAGSYFVSCSIGERGEESCDKHENAIGFSVVGTPFDTDESRGGLINCPLRWRVRATVNDRNRVGRS